MARVGFPSTPWVGTPSHQYMKYITKGSHKHKVVAGTCIVENNLEEELSLATGRMLLKYTSKSFIFEANTDCWLASLGFQREALPESSTIYGTYMLVPRLRTM